MTKTYVPPPKGDPAYPAMMWHPETGENRIFNSADEVPEGWLDTHPNNKDAAEQRKAAAEARNPPATLPLTRAEIVKALGDGGINFNPRAATKALYDQLLGELKKTLTEAGIAYEQEADAKTLLGLLPDPV